MPQDNLHMTCLEMTHSKKADEISNMVDTMRPFIPAICDYTHDHRARLIMPKIGFDASALALSFVPAPQDYTYHHLRRDVYDLCSKTGVPVDSRYVVPSSHLTIGRFINPADFEDEEKEFDKLKMETFIQKIEEINSWLEKDFWLDADGNPVPAGEWHVGEEKGLDCRMGRLWYGDGETVYLGKGF